jgi:hypothetical protein
MAATRFVITVGLVAVIIFLFAVSTLSTISIASSQSSPEYTGYQVKGPYTTLRVEGSWVVPTANCKATPNSVSNISVIIDGISGEGDAMEIGTYQNCVNGIAEYGAFVNIYPMTSFYGHGNLSDLVIRPGDVIEAQGTWRPSTTKIEPINWNTNIMDQTTGRKEDVNAYSPAGFAPVQNSGALILSSDGHTLTSLTQINSGREYTKVGNSDIVGAQHKIVTFGETASQKGYTLVTLDELPGTTPGPLTDNGSSFQITF